MEKQVKIIWKGEEVDVVLGPINFGEYKKIRRKSIVIRDFDGKPHQFRDVDLYEDLRTLFSIKEAPFPKTLESLYSLSLTDGSILEEAAIEVNAKDVIGRGKNSVN